MCFFFVDSKLFVVYFCCNNLKSELIVIFIESDFVIVCFDCGGKMVIIFCDDGGDGKCFDNL